MNYKFSDRVREVLPLARKEAMGFQHDYIDTEHILLALLRLNDGGAAEILRTLSVDIERLRLRVLSRIKRGKVTTALGELPYTTRGKKVLEFSIAAARQKKCRDVDTEHLLLGLIQVKKGLAAEVLREFGVTHERVLSVDDAQPWRAVSEFRVRIDDASDRSIYEQIIAQLAEAVAIGALEPGDRLPPVRQLADELDIAPGTVARAYSELERQRVVVTEGARGTRIAERSGSGVAERDRARLLAGLIRPVVVAAFHLGAGAAEVRLAVEEAMRGIFDRHDDAA